MALTDQTIQFVESLTEAMLLVKQDSNIEYANSSCAKLFGYTQDELQGMNLSNLMDDSFQVNHGDIVRDFINTGRTSKGMMARRPIPCLTANGNAFDALISISTLTLDGVSYGVALISDFTSLQMQISMLESDATHDSLTGLYNRRYLEKATEPNSRILSSWKQIAVLYLDLDKFKLINDTYGHSVGDMVLRVISQRITRHARFDDLVFRLGGDEFLFLMNLTNVYDVESNVHGICKKLNDEIIKPIEGSGISIQVDCSIGHSIYPGASRNLTHAIVLADKAMYLAKANKPELKN